MEEKTVTVTGYPFVTHVDQDLRPELPISFLEEVYTRCHSSRIDLLKSGCFKSMGYMYDFRPYLKSYLYKRHGQWHEVYAPNKTKLRSVVYGRIERIIEL